MSEEDTKVKGGKEQKSSHALDVKKIKKERDEYLKERDKYLKERDEYLDYLKRLQAEFENYKKRVERELLESRRWGSIEVIKELLPVLDNFDLAFGSEQSAEDFRKGVELIYAQFKELLKKNNIEEIKALGENFDPKLHEAVMTANLTGKKDNEIVEVFQKGYLINGRVLRHAKVKVNKENKLTESEKNIKQTLKEEK